MLFTGWYCVKMYTTLLVIFALLAAQASVYAYQLSRCYKTYDDCHNGGELDSSYVNHQGMLKYRSSISCSSKCKSMGKVHAQCKFTPACYKCDCS